MPIQLLIKITFLTIVLILFNTKGFSQEDGDLNGDQQTYLEAYIENLDGDGEFDFATIFEDLSFFLDDPLDLNAADYDHFKRLYLLNDLQINNILQHRDKYGDFLEVYELQTVEGLSTEEIRSIQPFITIKRANERYNVSFGDMIKSAQNTTYLKWRRVLETAKGYTDKASDNSRYLGDPNRLYVRHQLRFSDRLKIGFTAEKDEGEPMFNDLQKDFDYYSFHFHLRDYSFLIKDLVVGDYSISLGQGLILHNGFGAGKSTYVMDVKRGGRTVKSYTSVNEANFLRGGAFTFQLHEKLKFTAFASYKDIDANKSTDLNEDGFGIFTSIIQDGLHRSINERRKINTVKETSFGGQLGFETNKLGLRYNVLVSSYDNVFTRSSSLYNANQFRGDKLLNQSLDYSYRWRNMSFFGESAISDNGGMAHLHGVLLGLDRKIDMSLLYRNYADEYQSIQSNGFGETTGTQNEKGIYIGLAIKPSNRFAINMYADTWSHDWLRFRRDAPSRGREYLIKLDYKVKRKFNLYTQYKFEQKEINAADPNLKIDQLTPIHIERWRTHMSYIANKRMEFRSRVELSRYREESQSDIGYMVYQDFIFKSISFPVSLTSRIAYFDTPGFDSRIYAFENDLLYEYFIPFYADNGYRYYLNLRYNLSRSTTAEFRFAQTKYLDRETISSGNNLIDGSTRTQLKAQLRFRF